MCVKNVAMTLYTGAGVGNEVSVYAVERTCDSLLHASSDLQGKRRLDLFVSFMKRLSSYFDVGIT